MKKLVSVLLAVCLLLSAFPLTAFAAETDSGSVGDMPTSGTTGACTWTYDEATQTLTISGSGAMADYYDSTAVPWFQYSGRIKYINIGDGVTTVGDSAFAYLGGIGYVTLPDSLQAIGSEAFRGSSITGVNIPEGVKTIGARAFQGCKKLAYATLPESLQSIGLMAFGDTALKGIEVLNRNTQIGFYAFGFDVNGKKTDGFIVEGYGGSTANSYANSNGFTFIDLDSPQHALRVYMGNPFSVVTGAPVTKRVRESVSKLLNTLSLI